MANTAEKVEIQNIMTPGRTERVDKAKYEAMRKAFLAVLPDEAPGLAFAEAKAKLISKLPGSLFPGGDKAGWWLKAVQLDLEAKGIVRREETKPLRFYRSK
jgi:hypothetical protein